MDIKDYKPRRGDDTYRIGDSDDLVVMENIKAIPTGGMCQQNHGIIFICTAGRAQFEYDGHAVQLQKDDLFLYMVHSTVCNILTSPDFNCRQIWFTRSELWNIETYNLISVADMSHLKLHPVVHLNDEDLTLCDTYFQLLRNRIKTSTSMLTPNIVRSLLGTMMLELLSIMRRNSEQATEQIRQEGPNTSLHKKRIIDDFMKLVEESDGRIRRVDEFANLLNITPKYLSTIIKEVMNRRPSTYIQLYTMKAIEYRLRFTDMTMQEI